MIYVNEGLDFIVVLSSRKKDSRINEDGNSPLNDGQSCHFQHETWEWCLKGSYNPPGVPQKPVFSLLYSKLKKLSVTVSCVKWSHLPDVGSRLLASFHLHVCQDHSFLVK